MKISTKGRYALRVMLDLALHDAEAPVSLRDIGERQEITVKYLEQIIPLLNRAGLVRSTRGNAGGYRLTRAAADYTVGEILRVTEGSLAPVACLDDTPNRCPRAGECRTLSFWQGLYDVVNRYVDGCTLQDLVDRAGNTEGGDWCI